ncbi:hypothetical protein LNP26_29815 [Klebsiella variicola subsp. variicola]|nr:hypothetical protein [Klebsiella variicola subsp. variicola]
MKLKIRTIHGHGKANEEYVIIDVTDDCNAQYYMLADTTYTNDNKISNKVRHTHWFSKAELKKEMLSSSIQVLVPMGQRGTRMAVLLTIVIGG